MKQLQLIQILCINGRGIAAVADVCAKAARINRLSQASSGAKAASGSADAAFQGLERGFWGGSRFTAR
ncbi:hypothetical protein ACFIOY_32815 [Bradyrhizobium sp. TZ2]